MNHIALIVDDLQPATLAGFRRVRLAEASYPMLVADAAGEVEGVLLRRASARDIRRLNHLESEEYLAEQRPVRLEDSTLTAAWLYLPGDLEGVPKSALAATLFPIVQDRLTLEILACLLRPQVNGGSQSLAIVSLECCGASAH